MTVLEKNGVLEIVFDVNGKARRESITGIKPSATDADLFEVAQSIINLLSDTVSDVRRRIVKTYAA
ncbi:DUF1659 domain-containing protein [Caldisericum exile]|uniref:DUF1659 domain-containing protein n=1 Tax=Caldisericum exile (strain DSM 21853 / NBRC 104410 / AZM16c01) TaxID=511051 RepID=A0A7U6GFT7_CALEA|nr:DUF1659 domain-containing protein [Caldisericum exile]BAL81536.1 hypothetical protein CSE_14100 [Caldisericum exile AZM16c01]